MHRRTALLRSVVTWATIAGWAAACSLSLSKETVRLGPADGCPEWSREEFSRVVQGFDYTTISTQLECALLRLRESSAATAPLVELGARICFLLADRVEQDTQRRERLASEGVRWAEIALAQGSAAEGEVRYHLALNLGLVVREHVSLALTHLDRLVSELEAAHALDPDLDGSGPARVLGMLYLVAPPWPQGIGDGDKALELLEQAATRHPEHPLNHLFYARALWEVEGGEAREQVAVHLAEGFRILTTPAWAPACPRWRKEVAETVKQADLSLEQLDGRFSCGRLE